MKCPKLIYLPNMYVLLYFFFVISNSEWVEIPKLSPYPALSKFTGTGTIYYSNIKTPVNMTFRKEQINNDEHNDTHEFETKFEPEENIYLNQTLTSSTRDVLTDFETSYKDNSDYEDNEQDENEPHNTNNSSDGIFSFLKRIQNSLLSKAHKTLKSKVKLLTDLRNNLMIDIDRRLRTVWLANDENKARDYKDDSHVEFPSNEGALMTIGFLTLAVFLVKLVLQVIHAIKAKKMYYNATMSMMNMNTAAALIGRKKRFVTVDEQTTYDILRSIQNLKYN